MPWGTPVYNRFLDALSIRSGARLLDIGCGAGLFCRMAADRGASVAGIDIATSMITLARHRTPDGDFQVADMEHLPWSENAFDAITSFYSIMYARDLRSVLREMRRVGRSRSAVVIVVPGRPENCDSAAALQEVKQLVPPEHRPNRSMRLHEQGILERVVTQADMTPIESGYLSRTESYPDVDTLLRGWLAAGPVRRAVLHVGERTVQTVISLAIDHLRSPTGQVLLREEDRYVIARR
jgi:SAM-dependent methyltransferase